jgi:glycerol kinase
MSWGKPTVDRGMSNSDLAMQVYYEGRTYFKSKMEAKQSKKMYRKWEKAVQMSKDWDEGG